MEKILLQYGISIPKYVFVQDVGDLENLHLKYPVVAKVVSKDILHKSDVGGVICNIYDRKSLENALHRIIENVHCSKPEVLIEGFRIEEQISGVELFLGSKVDNAFGLVGAVGSGGIYVEIYKDVVFFLPDHVSTKRDALRVLSKTTIGNEIIEKGEIRGIKVNVSMLLKTLVAFAKMLQNENIPNIEINPLICNENRCVACDIRKV